MSREALAQGAHDLADPLLQLLVEHHRQALELRHDLRREIVRRRAEATTGDHEIEPLRGQEAQRARISSRRSPTIITWASSIPTSRRRSASHGPLRSWRRPESTSVPVTTMPARAVPARSCSRACRQLSRRERRHACSADRIADRFLGGRHFLVLAVDEQFDVIVAEVQFEPRCMVGVLMPSSGSGIAPGISLRPPSPTRQTQMRPFGEGERDRGGRAVAISRGARRGRPPSDGGDMGPVPAAAGGRRIGGGVVEETDEHEHDHDARDERRHDVPAREPRWGRGSWTAPL